MPVAEITGGQNKLAAQVLFFATLRFRLLLLQCFFRKQEEYNTISLFVSIQKNYID